MPARDDLSRIAAHLREAGTGGRGLRRELQKALTESARPIAEKISDVEHLKPYLPDRYAAILSDDLKVSVSKSFSGDPKITLVAKGRERKRKVVLFNRGLINHPVYARGEDRKKWNWSNRQAGGMKAGFFDDAVRDAAPELRERVMAALTETVRKITA